MSTPAFANVCASQLVVRPVAGLFESIKPLPVVRVDNFEIRTDVRTGGASRANRLHEILRVESDLFEGVHKRAHAKRTFGYDRRSMTLCDLTRYVPDCASKPAPSFLKAQGTIPLVEGRGIPTSVYLNLLQMRVAGVEYGGLKFLSTTAIFNARTFSELVKSPLIEASLRIHPDGPMDPRLFEDVIWQTNTGRYIMTTLTQCGVRPTQVRVDDLMVSNGILRSFRIEIDTAPI